MLKKIEDKSMVKVFIVDRQAVFRQGMRSCLSDMSDIEICGEADVVHQEVSVQGTGGKGGRYVYRTMKRPPINSYHTER